MCDKECKCESCNCEGVSEDMYESIEHEMLVVIKKMEYLDENDYFEMAATLEEMETQMRIQEELDELLADYKKELEEEEEDEEYVLYNDDEYYGDDDDCTSYVLSDRIKAVQDFDEFLSKYMKDQADIIDCRRDCQDKPCIISFGGENYPYRTIPLRDSLNLLYNSTSTEHSTDTLADVTYDY